MPVPDHVIGIIKEVFTTAKDAMPTNEAKDFVSNLEEYLVAKLKQKKVDDAEQLKKLYTSFMKAITSIINKFRAQGAAPDDMKHMLDTMVSILSSNY